MPLIHHSRFTIMSLSLACILFLVHSALAVLQKDDFVPDNWGENFKSRQGPIQYVKDPEECGFGYICDSTGKVLDVYDCTQFDAFYSISFKTCAVAAVLKAHGEETCEYVPPTNTFEPKKDDPLCNSYPNGLNPFPENCAKFVMCWDNESLGLVDCQPNLGFDPEKQRCEDLSVCGNRPVPAGWGKSES